MQVSEDSDKGSFMERGTSSTMIGRRESRGEELERASVDNLLEIDF